MSKRPYVDFRLVKDRVSIPDAMAALGIADRFTEKNGTYTGVCPIPTHKHGPNPNPQQFKINQKDGRWLWHCFGDCNRGGDVIELVKAVKELTNEHVRFWFDEHFGERLAERKDEPTEAPAQPTSPPDALPPLQPLRFFVQLDTDAALPYLTRRGVTDPAIIKRYRLGICVPRPDGKARYFDGYLTMPVYRYPVGTKQEYPVAYIGRWPGEEYDADTGRPRYKFPKDFEASRVVYGLRQAMELGHAAATPLIVVEGPFKVFHLAAHGFPNVVSTLTASMSDEQARLLVATARPIVLLFDGNDAGLAGMRKGAGKLIPHTFVRVIKLAESVEPDDLNAAELAELLAFAKPADARTSS